jgi:tetratricopeptide (TPR) repeat protein
MVAFGVWLLLAAATPTPAPTRAPAAAKRTGTAAPTKRTPAPRRAVAPKVAPRQQAADAGTLEELGAYSEVVNRLRALRHDVAPDADLELALALNEARTGQLDSAAARLAGPVLTRALADSMPLTRRVLYPWHRDPFWINGKFDGWPWYILRARAEVAATRGRWSEALEASRRSLAANPLAGREWLIFALCTARTGDAAGAEAAAGRAAYLDPGLPEAYYLEGLLAWKAGRRIDALSRFRAAVALDSTWQAPALALLRSRFPGSAPDTLPGTFLTGLRRVALVTSPVRPKPEEFVQMDLGASVQEQKLLPLPDTLLARMKPVKLFLNVLVDDRGHPIICDLPWFPPGQFPEDALHLTLASVPGWKFRPGVRLGRPHPVWTTLQITFDPQTSNR